MLFILSKKTGYVTVIWNDQELQSGAEFTSEYPLTMSAEKPFTCYYQNKMYTSGKNSNGQYSLSHYINSDVTIDKNYEIVEHDDGIGRKEKIYLKSNFFLNGDYFYYDKSIPKGTLNVSKNGNTVTFSTVMDTPVIMYDQNAQEIVLTVNGRELSFEPEDDNEYYLVRKYIEGSEANWDPYVLPFIPDEPTEVYVRHDDGSGKSERIELKSTKFNSARSNLYTDKAFAEGELINAQFDCSTGKGLIMVQPGISVSVYSGITGFHQPLEFLPSSDSVSNNYTFPISNDSEYYVIKNCQSDLKTINISEEITNGQILINPQKVPAGEKVIIKVKPDTGYKLKTLTVKAGNNNISVYSNMFTMPSKDVTVSAEFEQIEYTITSLTAENGAVTAQVNDNTVTTAHYGDDITLKIEPKTGYQLKTLSVKDKNNETVTVTENKFKMPASNVTISAEFETITYAITTAAENGTITAQVNNNTVTAAHEDDEVTLIIEPETGYQLKTLTVIDENNEEVTVTENQFKMPASNVTVSAEFEHIDYTIKATAENGTVTVKVNNKAAATAHYNDIVNLTVEPDTGYILKTLTVKDANGKEINVTNGQFVMPNSNITVSAVCEITKFTVTWKNSDGSVLETDKNVPYGSTPSYDGETPSIGEGYIFIGWNPKVTILTGNVTYVATYKQVASSETDSGTDSDTTTDTDKKTDTDTATDTDKKTDTDTATDTDKKTDTDTVTDTDKKTDTDTATDTDKKTDTDTVTDTDKKTDTDTATDTDKKTDTDTATDTDKKTDTDTATDTDKKADTDTATDTDKKTDTDTATDTDKKTDTDTATDTDKKTDTDTVTDTDKKTDTDTVTDTDKKTDTDTATDTDKKADTDTVTDTDKKTDIDTATDTDKKADTDTATDTDKKADTDTATDTDKKADTDTATDTESDTDSDATPDTPDEPDYGDVNMDGKVTARDSLLAQRYVINLIKLTDEQFRNADVDRDGKVTAKDALNILRSTINMAILPIVK
ncbi:MAG: hypothetical protein VZR27_09455 [Acutalibacteraceae bacterium]|nr:hypothetical protein [Acutalibacteraceae bacterium]